MFEQLKGREPGLIEEELYKKYTVVVPYLPETGELLFQVRADGLDTQPGEICYPGGAIEAGETAAAAGIREIKEELMVREDSVELIAPLDTLVTPFYTMIHVFVANLKNYACSFQTDEVKEVFAVPFSFFQDTQPKMYYNKITTRPEDENYLRAMLGKDSYPWAYAKSPVFFYHYEKRVIWGITAKITKNLVDLNQKKK